MGGVGYLGFLKFSTLHHYLDKNKCLNKIKKKTQAHSVLFSLQMYTYSFQAICPAFSLRNLVPGRDCRRSSGVGCLGLRLGFVAY